MGLILSKEAILGATDRKREEVAVPEWGGSVLVQAISGSERDAFEASVQAAKGKMNLANIRARLCALTIVDEQGIRLFTDREAGLLGDKSAAALDRVFDAALRLAGMRQTDVEELVENFTDGPKDDSTSN